MKAATTIRKLLIAYHRFPPIAQDLKEAFIRRGVNVELFYTTDYEHWFYRRIIRAVNRHARNLRLVPKGADLFKRHPWNLHNYVSTQFENACRNHAPDAVLVIHGLPFGEACLSALAVPKIGWHLEPRDDLPYLAQNARPFDIYNSFSDKDVALLAESGFDCRYLSHAADPKRFWPQPDALKTIDLSFVGNWSPWRDEVVKAALRVTDNVCLYGDQWTRKSSIDARVLRRIYKGRSIVGPALNALFNASRIILNASRIKGSFGLNMRFFEVLSAGGLLLTDQVPELPKHFVADTHLVVYDDADQLETKMRLLMNDTALRERTQTAGQLWVRRNHTYDEMAAHFLDQAQEVLARKDIVSPAPEPT